MSRVFLAFFFFWPHMNNIPQIFNYTDTISVVLPKTMAFLPFVFRTSFALIELMAEMICLAKIKHTQIERLKLSIF